MRTLCRFVLRFALWFGLLAWPWPGLRQAVSACFRVEARFLVGVAFPHRAAWVEPTSDSRFPSLDTRVVVPNLPNSSPDGRTAALMIPFDSHAQGWMPLAMLIALGLATPVPWSKRLKLWWLGVVWVQILTTATILVSVSFNLSSALSPVGGHLLCRFAHRLIVENIWFSFVPSFLLWAGWLAWSGHWKDLEELLADKAHSGKCCPGRHTSA